MENTAYTRPPIIEAVIALQFAEGLDEPLVKSLSDAIGASYAGHVTQKINQVHMRVDLNGNVVPGQATESSLTYRHTSGDQLEIAVVNPGMLFVSQLPDYPGWTKFFARFQRDWTVFKKRAGYRKISQLGVRYINRLDLPAPGPLVHQQEYLGVYAELPDSLGPTLAYAVQARLHRAQVGAILTINSGVVPSPIEGRLSILLDIDLARATDVPQRDDEMFALLEQFRVEKNTIFETCVTDKARELFGQ